MYYPPVRELYYYIKTIIESGDSWKNHIFKTTIDVIFLTFPVINAL